MKRLLILSCSQRKRFSPELMPAIERYDGPAFRLVRGFLKQQPSKIDILILSSFFGLIRPNKHIPHYDNFLSKQRACEIQPQVARSLQRICATKAMSPPLFLCMGKTYRDIVLESVPKHAPVQYARGSIGMQLVALHAWLYSDSKPIKVQKLKPVLHNSNVILHGKQIALTKVEALEAIRRMLLLQNEAASDKPHSWYVSIDGFKLPAKWVVSQLTGLGVGTFHTDAARRVLHQLGLQTHREPMIFER